MRDTYLPLAAPPKLSGGLSGGEHCAHQEAREEKESEGGGGVKGQRRGARNQLCKYRPPVGC